MNLSPEGSLRRNAEKPWTEREFTPAVKLRARGLCEACDFHYLEACSGRYDHAHHIMQKSRGQGWPSLHDPEANGLGVSYVHHAWLHAHPAESVELGFLRHSWDR